MALDELIPSPTLPVAGESSRLWEGTILDDAATPNDLVRVALPGADGEQHAQGPCPFMPRGAALPQKGDRCLVAIDDDGSRWIAAWENAQADPVLLVPLVSALPGSPSDGDTIDFQSAAMATAGLIWRFRYNAGSPDTHKWERVGGGWLAAEVTSQSTRANAAYGDPTGGTTGPSITLPGLAGDYEIVGSARALITSTGVSTLVAAVKLGAAATSDNEMVALLSAMSSAGAELKSNYGGSAPFVRALAAGAAVKFEYKASAGTGAWEQRRLAVRPVRVS